MSIRSNFLNRVKQNFFYGWIILAAATLAMFASGPGQSHTIGIFVDSISLDLEISKLDVAYAYGLATLVAAFGLAPMGRLVDRIGPRLALILISIFLGLCCMAFGSVSGIIALSLGFAALRFLGQGSMMLGATNLTAQWFAQRRGFAMGIVMLGFAASIALHPILSQWLIDLVGWRQAWVWIGVITWALMLPMLILFVFDRPEPLGILPDGAEFDDNVSQSETGPDHLTGLTFAEARKTTAFWIISAGLFTPAMLITALFFHQVSIFETHGLPRTLGAGLFSLSAIAMALAMPVVGWCLDRFPTKYVFASTLALLSVTLVATTFVDDLVTALFYAVIFGVNTAANMTFFGYMWAHYFGRRHLGSIQGIGQMIGVIGASLGPLPLSFGLEYFGSYDSTIWATALLPIICAGLAFFLKAPEIPNAATPEREV